MPGFTKSLLAASALVALSAGAAQADIVIATAGPMTGQYAIFGEQMQKGAEQAVKDLNAAGGVLGEQLSLEVGDDACDPKQAVAVANQMVNAGVVLHGRAFLLRLVDPGLAGLQRGGHPADLARLDQPAAHRAGLRQRLPHLRPRRPAGHLRRRLRGRQQRRQQGRGHPRQDRLRQGPRRRVQEAAQRARRRGGHVRGDHRRRQGLHRADHQDEGSRRRPDLSRRLPHRGRPDRPPGERAGARRRR